jgi:hypothetical protein
VSGVRISVRGDVHSTVSDEMCTGGNPFS